MSIVRLEEVFYADGKVLMVLEYLPGGDLFDGLVSRPFYSEKDACACAQQIIRALHYLSRKGIIHRVMIIMILILYTLKWIPKS